MNKYLTYSIIGLTLLFSGPILGQDFTGQEKEIYDVVIKLFDGMRAGDSAMVHSVFHKDARMYTNSIDKDGNNKTVAGEVRGFLHAVGTPHEEIWDEKIWNTEIRLEMGVAQVWTDYAFYRGNIFSHCGIDAFQLVNDNGWKIIHLIDTRKRENCDMEKN